MKRQQRLTGCIYLLAAVTLVWSPLTAAEQNAERLNINVDLAGVSKYIWRGYDILDDHGAFQPSITADLYGTGLSVNIWASIPAGSGYEDATEFDYTLAYAFSLFPDEVYAMDIVLNYIYFDYIKLNHMADCHEMGIYAAMPNLLHLGDITLVPGYYVGKLWPNSSGVSDVAGFFHVLDLSFDMPLSLPGRNDPRIFSFYADLTYNDGALGADHDWSHSTLGVSTSFSMGSAAITPFLRYQISMDDSVNNENEVWTGISLSMNF